MADVALFYNSSWQCSLLTSLEDMWRNKILCDAIVVSKQGTEHLVHSVVLAAASNVFRDRLTKTDGKQTSSRVLLSDKDDNFWNMAFQFLYTGCLHVPLKYRGEFRTLCEEYCIEPLLSAKISTSVSSLFSNNSNSNCKLVCLDSMPASDYQMISENDVTVLNGGGSQFSDDNAQADTNAIDPAVNGDAQFDSEVIASRELCVNPRMHLWKKPRPGDVGRKTSSSNQQVDGNISVLSVCDDQYNESRCEASAQSLQPEEILRCFDGNLSMQNVQLSSTPSSLVPANPFCSDPASMVRCPTCNGMYKTDSIRRHKYCCKGMDKVQARSQQLAKAYCNECGQAFMSKKGLKFHMLWHRGEKPAVCPVCSATFRQAGYLKEHMRSHTGERPEVCSVCQKSFFNKSALKRHLVIHTRSDPHECDQCGASFSHQRTLQCHMTTAHSQRKAHVCFVCSSSFCSRGALGKHIRKKHPDTTLPVNSHERLSQMSASEAGESSLPPAADILGNDDDDGEDMCGPADSDSGTLDECLDCEQQKAFSDGEH